MHNLPGHAKSPTDPSERLAELLDLVERHLTVFERTGDRGALKTAIRYSVDAADLGTNNHSLHFRCLRLSSRAFLQQFQLSHDSQDLDTALRWGREAVKNQAQEDPERLNCLIETTNGLVARYELTQSQNDLEEAVGWSQELLALCPEDDPETRVQILWTVTRSIRCSFERSGESDELEKLIYHYKDLVSICEPKNPLCAPSHYHFALACKTRYKRTSEPAHLEDSVSSARSALAVHLAGHPHRTMCLDMLGEAMLMQYRVSADPNDILAAISVLEEALDLQSNTPSRSDYFKALIKLADALFVKWKESGDEEAMERTAEICRKALKGCPRDHPLRPFMASLLRDAQGVLSGSKLSHSSRGGMSLLSNHPVVYN